MQRTGNTDTEAMKEAIVQAAVEAAKAMVLAIGKEGWRQNTNTEQNGKTEAPRHRTGPSLWQQVFNWSAK